MDTTNYMAIKQRTVVEHQLQLLACTANQDVMWRTTTLGPVVRQFIYSLTPLLPLGPLHFTPGLAILVRKVEGDICVRGVLIRTID